MREKPSTQDARLIMQLHRLQLEADMRQARLWWRAQFWPKSPTDYLKIERAPGTRQNRWLRQVFTFWGMTASFVLDQTLSEEAFLHLKFSEEVFDLFLKVRPFLKELRKRTKNPDFLGNVEKVIHRSHEARARLRAAAKRLPTGRVRRSIG